MSPAPTPLPEPPERLGGFRVRKRLRQSGVLAVHGGRDSLDLPVHMHLVWQEALSGGFGSSEFLDTVRRTASVQHASLVTFVTGGEQDGWLYAVARETGGLRVGELLDRGGALAEERALGIAAECLRVIAVLESVGLHHGDLTPRRILLPGRGRVLLRPPRLVPAPLVPRYARYQAPEQAAGHEGDTRSDLFVVGLILLQMLTGENPMPGSGKQVNRALAAGRVPDLPGGLRPALRDLLSRLLGARPELRPAGGTEAVRAIEAVISGSAAEAAPVAAPPGAAPAAPPSPGVVHERPETAPIDLIPDLLPLPDELPSHADRPETAPIDVAAVRAELASAPGPAPASPARAAAALAGSARRNPGRLYLDARLGESMLEIDEDVHIGRPADAIDIKARSDTFPDAVIRVERAGAADVLHALADGVRVNGTAVTTHELAQGDTIAAPGVTGRYERAARGALRATGAGMARRSNPASKWIVLASIGGGLAAIAWGASQALDVEDATARAHAAAQTAEQELAAARFAAETAISVPDDRTAAELAARRAYDAARAWARQSPDDRKGAQRALRDVAEKHDGTAYAALAALEASQLTRRSGGGPATGTAGALEGLLTEAEIDAAEGRLDAAVLSLRRFAEDHPETPAAARARREIVRLTAVVEARFESDMATIDAAMKEGKWRTALRTADEVMDYVPLSMRDRALAKKYSVEAAMNRPLEEDGGGPTDTPRPPPDGPRPADDPTAGDGDPAARDAAALKAFRAARSLMDVGKDVEALDAFLAFLRDYGDTPTGAKYDVETRKRITTLSMGPAGIAKLFRGKVEKRDRGRWRITYDFEDEDQLLDFRDVNAFEAPPRANWTIVSGAARAKGSGALALDARFSPDFLTMAVTVNPERAHDLGAIFFEFGESQRFYAYTLQNSFFTLGLGPDAQPFKENAVVLFGPDMWRDTPKGKIGYVRKCGSDKPKFRPGESIPIKAGKVEEEVWMRFEGGRTIRGSAYGDLKYEFKGLQPGVFVVNSSGFFDEIVIEGVPDTDWVAQRWRDLLSGL